MTVMTRSKAARRAGGGGMTVKIGTKLPKDEDRNGLDSLFRDLLNDPHRPRVAIVVLETSKITKDLDNYDTVPTVTIRAIEPVDGEDAGHLRNMLLRAYEARTGQVELPAEWTEVLVDLTSPTIPGSEPGR